jgi:phosphatidylserine/phosphatidylglycerophosphate/cardiolipin synthase-like enzyme
MQSRSRDFTAPWQARAIQEALQSLFAAELAQPSVELWLLSAWVTDLDLLDNSGREFAGLRPDWPATRIALSRVLVDIASRGARVCVVVRDAEHNRPFIRRLREQQAAISGRLGVAVSPNAHEKTLVGDDYVLGGSMNLTFNGTTRNDEHMLLRVDRSAAASRRLDLNRRWGSELSWA